MAKKKPPVEESEQDVSRYEASEQDKAKAAAWFKRALEFGELRKYDSAIAYYVNGLEFWPDAVEDGLKPLHGCGVALRQSGGKKPGLKDTMRRSLTAKDPKQALLNALWLFGHDPDNISYVEGVLKNANRLHADDCMMWAAPVYRRLLDSERKPNTKRYLLLKDVLEELSDRAVARSEVTRAIDALTLGVEALTHLSLRLPRDRETETAIRDLSTKLTIIRGRYEGGESFRDSMRDEDAQKDIHDEERLVQSDERLDELINKAEAEYREHPDEPITLNHLVGLLCRRERYDEEVRAIGHLVTAYKRTDSYAFKQRADDIRMKQLRRGVREAREKGDKEAVQTALRNQLRFEMAVFKERTERYPTDLRIKYELGVRLFQVGRFDDAIPVLQMARGEPKTRAQCSLYLGRCFFAKKFYSEAINTFNQVMGERERDDDDVGKELLYWLGRSLEDHGKMADARRTYGKILQIDYTYRDVRDRLEKLPDEE